MRYNPARHRLPAFEQDGILLVDKPTDWTSFDVVNCLRGRFNIPKVGHCGTLDPAATGLLVLVLGKFTRLNQKFSGDDKTYESTLLLGVETNSEDMTGEILKTSDCSNVTPEQVKECIMSFLGPQKQVPPMVSAIKKDGHKLCDLARKGIEVEREARDIVIHEIEITRVELPEVDFMVKCSKGTYIRTLCSDIGKKLGVGGALKVLRRTQSGIFSLNDALPLEEIKNMEQADLALKLKDFLFQHLSKVSFSDEKNSI